VAADERGHRLRVIEEFAADALAHGAEHIALRVHPLDACAPYGALLPWLTRWSTPPSKAPAAATPRASLTASYSIALAGLMFPSGAPSEDPSAGARPVEAAPETHAPLRPLSPEEVRAELLELVEGRARQRATVVSLQDVQHLDPASTQWLDFLGRRVADLPLLVLLGIDPHVESPDDWKARLGTAPLFVDRAPPMSSRPEPTVRLNERLRPLPPRSIDVLLTATLAGPDATPDLVREVLGWEAKEVDLAISPVADQGLLEARRDILEVLEPALYPDLAGTVARPKVAASHRSIARAIAKREPHPRGPLLFRLSEHWAEGGEVTSGVSVLSAASLEAERWGSPEIAEMRLRRALALAQSEPTAHGRELEERMFSQLAVARGRAGDQRASSDAFSRALALAQQRKAKPQQWVRYLCGFADAQTRLGADPEERLTQTLDQLRGRSNELEALVHRSLGFYYVEHGRSDLAVENSERACVLAEQGSDLLLRVRCHQIAMNAYIFRGDSPEKAREHAQKALSYRSHIEGTADAGVLVILMDGLANVECALGNEQEAIRRGEEALKAAGQYGHRTALLLVLGNLSEHYVDAGQYRRAAELAEELRQACDRLGLSDRDPSRQQWILLQGIIASGEGRYDEADRHLHRLTEISEGAGGRYFVGQSLVHLSVLSVRRGDPESARRYIRRLEKEGVRKTLVGQNRRMLEEIEAKIAVRPPASKG
jgi:tetratricopeptide (TPR) repeat protein